MTPVAQIAKTFFSNIWEMFLGVEVPGLGVSFAALAIALFLIRFSLSLFGFITGFGMGYGDYGKAADAAERYKSSRQKRDPGDKLMKID